jgi:hypothetical protein
MLVGKSEEKSGEIRKYKIENSDVVGSLRKMNNLSDFHWEMTSRDGTVLLGMYGSAPIINITASEVKNHGNAPNIELSSATEL